MVQSKIKFDMEDQSQRYYKGAKKMNSMIFKQKQFVETR